MVVSAASVQTSPKARMAEHQESPYCVDWLSEVWVYWLLDRGSHRQIAEWIKVLHSDEPLLVIKSDPPWIWSVLVKALQLLPVAEHGIMFPEYGVIPLVKW